MEMNVLVVDNEKGFASILADHLKTKSINAESVYSGRDALSTVMELSRMSLSSTSRCRI